MLTFPGGGGGERQREVIVREGVSRERCASPAECLSGVGPGRGGGASTWRGSTTQWMDGWMGIDKYALFIDVEKAFDRIHRGHLWSILQHQHYNVPLKLVRVIRSMHTQCTSKVSTIGIESTWFEIQSGHRQGDVLSPLLFMIFMDKCLRDIGAGADGEEVVMYADDVAVIADSAVAIQDVANRWWEGMIRAGKYLSTKVLKYVLKYFSCT